MSGITLSDVRRLVSQGRRMGPEFWHAVLELQPGLYDEFSGSEHRSRSDGEIVDLDAFTPQKGTG